jgi:chemotaxis-related protein WspB
MLMLLFYVGEERYAIAAKSVVEVVPMVSLKKVYNAPEYVAGLFNYRGHIVPVIDVCQLIQNQECQLHLSTRIIILNYLVSQEKSKKTETTRLLGMMAERVTETTNRSESDLIPPTVSLEKASYFGGIITDERGMIQCLRVENLLPASQSAYLLPESEDNR